MFWFSFVAGVYFGLYLQEKYKIASDKLGSGNTKNIASIKTIEGIKNGTGPFSTLGQTAFENYWREYPNYKSLENYMENHAA